MNPQSEEEWEQSVIELSFAQRLSGLRLLLLNPRYRPTHERLFHPSKRVEKAEEAGGEWDWEKGEAL